MMTQFVTGKNLVIRNTCKNLIEQCQSYAWCPKAQERGEDKPIKKDDHAVDSCRYLIASCFKNGLQGVVDQNMTIEEIRRRVYGQDDIYTQFNQQTHGF